VKTGLFWYSNSMSIVSSKQEPGYLALCYHYVRSPEQQKLFPRILGNSVGEFGSHLRMLQSSYNLISLQEALGVSKDDVDSSMGTLGMLITFDDGLSDHFKAAEILADQGVKAVFFISTCIFADQLPANPTIIHYVLARYGIGRFLDEYRSGLEQQGLPLAAFDVRYERGKDDPWKTIGQIKALFKYKLGNKPSRSLLLHIYRNTLLKEFPDALSRMHLTEKQVEQMLAMGHSIGVHSRTHVSIGASDLSEREFDYEVIEPRSFLEKRFRTPVIALSYPFGETKDCLPFRNLLSQTKAYEMAFTVEEIVNRSRTSPFELGRYMPMSTDTSEKLKTILTAIAQKSPVVS
jgi:peptidoglycan/xylan/chitin deacetylase (PgdA/CDA1 family)